MTLMFWLRNALKTAAQLSSLRDDEIVRTKLQNHRISGGCLQLTGFAPLKSVFSLRRNPGAFDARLTELCSTAIYFRQTTATVSTKIVFDTSNDSPRPSCRNIRRMNSCNYMPSFDFSVAFWKIRVHRQCPVNAGTRRCEACVGRTSRWQSRRRDRKKNTAIGAKTWIILFLLGIFLFRSAIPGPCAISSLPTTKNLLPTSFWT
ncbi:hypothetical protein C8R45DRAFT_541988 [Mycena sanguinolenta]|nr:hypothetical protein C8R45DRAFT_541988 [Mycena sanguinolenta]